MFQPKTIIEPFRVKVIEPLPLNTREVRAVALKKADFNLFRLSASDVIIDLLTDSGTSAMSAEQWAQVMRGDESYAGSLSFEDFEKTFKEVMGYDFILPTHQGRASERILFSVVAAQRGLKRGYVLNNAHFDTTRANAEALGFEALDFPCEEFSNRDSDFPWKGNMNLEKLERFLTSTPSDQVAMGMMTLTNNSCGGQPASLENIRAVSQLYKKFNVPFYLDACRFAENVAFIRKNECLDRTPLSLAQEIFSLADGCTFSAKKDALVNIGGVLATRHSEIVEDMKALLILTEGFPTYGGLAGRDLGAMAQGLKEVLDPHYLDYRLAITRYMSAFLSQKGIPHLKPAGGHALYLDAQSLASHLKWSDYPGQSLALALYLEGGIRSCEIGSVMFGRQADGTEKQAKAELVRLAIPRRVYTQSHMDYVLEVIEYVASQRTELKPVRISHEPKRLRHFSAEFTWGA
jgi:tryptophanase